MLQRQRKLIGLSVGIGFLMSATMVEAAELPASTKAILAKLKVEPGILKGIDAELKVPAKWLKQAAKEGSFKITGSWDPSQFRALTAPFRERYPNIKINYSRGGLHDRGMKPLMALKAGRFLYDVIISPGGDWVRYKQINALEDLRVLPNYNRLAKIMREPEGNWVAQKVAHRCMSYNTKLVKKSEMPKRWEDLVTDPRWRGGRLGIPNRPSLWLSMLWLDKGPKWTTNFMEKMFKEVKPQLRKEGANAMISLTVAGEFHDTVGSAAYRLKQYRDKGAPIALHCPVPVPLAISIMMVLKNNPHKYASLMFTNWFISKEGQISQYAANNAIPVRADLASRKEFVPYPEEIAGKPMAVRDEGKLVREYPRLIAVYDPLWKAAGGPVEKTGPSKKVTIKLTGVKRGGRIITFKLKGKDERARISRRRTQVYLNDKNISRKKLKPGMTCDVTYPGKGGRATTVSCKK
jgi:iron(III) transport system substrate-binding protein